MLKKILKIVLGVVIVSILSFFGYWGYLEYLAPPNGTPVPLPASVEQDIGPRIISAEGKVIPQDHAQLSFNVPGLVETLTVKEGDIIQAGEVIATLKGREQVEASISAAKMELISAQQALDELIDQAPLQTAQAQQELANAWEALDEAESDWYNNQEGNRASGEAIESTEDRLAVANQVVKRAEEEYSRFADRPEDDPIRVIAYSALQAARQRRNQILGQLYWYQGSPSDIEQAKLDADLAMAEARMYEAERQWDILRDGPDPDEIALAEARVESAETQLEAAQANLDDLELLAPFTGTIISLDLKVGESVSPAIPIVTLANLSQWQVETTDLTESDFALISHGMDVIITLNAYPEREFRGVIRDIALLGEERRGSVTYTVTLDLEPDDAIIQWGMTAFVDIPVD